MNKVYILMFLLITAFTFVSNGLFELFGMEPFQGMNQLAILFLFFYLWISSKRKLVFPRGYFGILVMMSFFLILEFLFSSTNNSAFIVGLIMTFLFVFVFLVSFNLGFSLKDFIKLLKGVLLLVLLLTSTLVFQILFEDVGFRDTSTLLRHSSIAAGMLSCGLIIAFSLFFICKRSMYYYISIFISGLILISTFKKTLISMIIIWILFLMWERRKPGFYLSGLLILSLGVVAFAFGGQEWASVFTKTVNQFQTGYDSIPRVVLLKTAFDIAVEKFPFGSGLGTFASVPSISMGYSAIYDQYGMSKVWGFSQSSIDSGNNFTLDCYWAHILGELGFVGTILFFTIWSYPAISTFALRKKQKSKDLWSSGVSFFVTSIFLIMTIEGFGYYYVENASFIVIHAGLVGMAFCILKKVDIFPNPLGSECEVLDSSVVAIY